MSDFSKPYRVDRCNEGGGIFLYIKEGIISKYIPVSLNSNKLKRKEVVTSFGSREYEGIWTFCPLGHILVWGVIGHFRLYDKFSCVKLF